MFSALESADAGGAGDSSSEEESGKYNRAEKKARKVVTKLGLKPVPNVERVYMKKGKDVAFVIVKPDVYKAPGADSYVIFGEAKVEGYGGPEADFGRIGAGGGANDAYAKEAAKIRKSVQGSSKPAGGDVEESTDETGLEARDIELVMQQAGVSRGKAASALKKAGGDLVSAIMELTSE